MLYPIFAHKNKTIVFDTVKSHFFANQLQDISDCVSLVNINIDPFRSSLILLILQVFITGSVDSNWLWLPLNNSVGKGLIDLALLRVYIQEGFIDRIPWILFGLRGKPILRMERSICTVVVLFSFVFYLDTGLHFSLIGQIVRDNLSVLANAANFTLVFWIYQNLKYRFEGLKFPEDEICHFQSVFISQDEVQKGLNSSCSIFYHRGVDLYFIRFGQLFRKFLNWSPFQGLDFLVFDQSPLLHWLIQKVFQIDDILKLDEGQLIYNLGKR